MEVAHLIVDKDGSLMGGIGLGFFVLAAGGERSSLGRSSLSAGATLITNCDGTDKNANSAALYKTREQEPCQDCEGTEENVDSATPLCMRLKTGVGPMWASPCGLFDIVDFF